MFSLPAAILTERNTIPVVDEVQLDEPQAGEVLVSLRATGICHTDLAAVRDARTYPIILGHEGAGVVTAIGDGVTQVAPGDHVVINWQPRCNRCFHCQRGRSDLCERVTGTSSPRTFWRGKPIATLLHAGTFCSAVVVPEGGTVAIRRDLSFGEAALLGCAVATGVGAALFTAKVYPGANVAVLGVGGVGLNVIQGTRLAMASRIVAIDIKKDRLSQAREFGATDGFIATDPRLTEEIWKVTDGRGMDFVFEVVGSTELMRKGIDLLGRGGELLLVGAAARDKELAFLPRRFMSLQQAIRGSIYGNIRPGIHLPMLADWCCSGDLKVRDLIGQSVTLEEVPAIFRNPSSSRGIRTIIEWPASTGQRGDS